jgi:large subunit ribosomal protein L10
MLRPEKEQRVKDISEQLSSAKSVFMTDFKGLTVDDMTRLRQEFRKAGVKYVVVKNTLARLSAEKIGHPDMIKFLNGPTGLALAFEDPVAPVRVIHDFENAIKPTIKAAIVEGQLLDEQAAEEIRKIPPRQVLLGQLVSGIVAPISGLVGSLKAVMSNLVNVLDQIKETKQS